uniref:Uncharacterized protein n=1 Tax=Ananas comosus var. bracteatus TaxID=296719 RepID=A0A6V7QTI8_ANACO
MVLTDGSVPNTLVIANCEVVKPRVAAAEHISQFNEEARSPFVKKFKTIIHPGEVNRIRELPQNSKIVATHTDSPDVLIWDVEAQPNRHAVLGAAESRPDLKGQVSCLVSIQDHISTLAESASKSPVSPGSSGNVQFCPSSAQEFCSVGDDSCLIFWDARVGTSPVVKVEKAHNADLHCVDWNPHDMNLILTGRSADTSVRMFDRRNLTSGVLDPPFTSSKATKLLFSWSPDKATIFGSAAEDGFLNIWDHEKVGKKKERTGTRTSNTPPGLFFQHAGHRDKVVDFHWNAYDPWTIVSVSDDGRVLAAVGHCSDLIYRPEEEVLAELEKFKAHLASCTPKA